MLKMLEEIALAELNEWKLDRVNDAVVPRKI